MDPHSRETDTYVKFTPEIIRRMESAVSNILALLDEVSVDVELEDGADDECYTMGSTSDMEGDHCDDEPWLSAGTERWNTNGSDRDLECDTAYYDCPLPIEGGQGL
jgi:hypothetical protein